MHLLTRHRLWQLLARRGHRRRGVVARVLPLASASRSTSRTTQLRSGGRSCSIVLGVSWSSSSASASTRAGGATSRRATCGRIVRECVACLGLATWSIYSPAIRVARLRLPRGRRGDGSAPRARVRRRLAAARAHAASSGRPAGVVARGKEVIVVGAGDAGQLIVQEMQRYAAPRLHADRLRRRRSAQAALAHHGSPRARHDRRACRTASARAPSRRGC